MMQEGTYYGTIKSAVTGESKSTKKPQVCITFDVTHEANGGEWEPLDKPVERMVFLSLTDAAWQYSEEKLKKLGFNGDFDSPQFKEQNASLTCRVEKYEGKDKEKWDIAGEGYQPTAAGKDITRTLNAKWKNANRATPANSAKPLGKPAAPSKKPAPAPVGAGSENDPLSEDDIPFE